MTQTPVQPPPDEAIFSTQEPAGAAPPDARGPAPTVAEQSRPTVPTTRTAVAWSALGFSMVLLILVLVFVLQNLSATRTTFFGFNWTIPLGLDLLLAALFGDVIAFLLGAARMLQLRRVARRFARSQKRG